MAKSLEQKTREWQVLWRHKLHVAGLKFGWTKDAAPQPLQPDLDDGLPVPPPYLIYLVGGNTNANAFLHGGMRIGQTIRELLLKNGIEMERFGALLDFGCGCGRGVRQWKDLKGPKVYGTDYNPQFIGWCRANLPFAQFDRNQLTPPLRYADATFDFIYAFSVFTHLTEPVQFAWMKEFKRVLKPGGYLLISLHGESFLHLLDAHHQQRFKNGEMFVLADFAEGTNLAASFHPDSYVRGPLADAHGFDVIDHAPPTVGQDFYLLRSR